MTNNIDSVLYWPLKNKNGIKSATNILYVVKMFGIYFFILSPFTIKYYKSVIIILL